MQRIGGAVQAPVLLYAAQPKYTAEARAKSLSGAVLIKLQVDESGNPSHVVVARGLDEGLDQQAVAAVSQYRFKPAMKNGVPVRVEMNVEVQFQVF